MKEEYFTFRRPKI